ncbi:expressed tetratricopeptide repeat protein [Nitzschia inconspicua]|uniref:Expressed tetratricopeptide repeat protein n=1 Tax=Nitzschia inconspicua TaxID=303405 RepID=A0A9K3M765_9STRA|nr:expressed tetratricopeptide repeat protein [Nitzschia inconspicua]
MSLAGTKSLISQATAEALQFVSHQNNMGVSLYNQGRYTNALRCFKKATRDSKTFLTRPLEERGRNIDAELYVSFLVLPSQGTHSQEIHSSIDPFVYWTPFVILVSLAESRDNAFLEQRMVPGDGLVEASMIYLFTRLSTMLIYNTALAHHAIASQSEDNLAIRRDFLSKARDLYSLAYSISQREHEKDNIDPVLSPLFILSILNNLGQSYAFLDDTENAVKCFKMLLENIIIFQQKSQLSCIFGELNDRSCYDQSIARFLNNTLFLILKDPGFAPAA